MLDWIDAEVTSSLVVRISASAAGIRAIEFAPGRPVGQPSTQHRLLREAQVQLRAYFEGQLREFNLPLDMAGTPFQLQVWRQLLNIPYGETRSYLSVAQAIGRPAAVRAVGAANGANPVPIVVPCHRVIGSSGKLVGYGGGLPLKKLLLSLERIDQTMFWPAR